MFRDGQRYSPCFMMRLLVLTLTCTCLHSSREVQAEKQEKHILPDFNLDDSISSCSTSRNHRTQLPDLSHGLNFSKYELKSLNAHMKIVKSTLSALVYFVKHVSEKAASMGLPKPLLLDVGGNSGKSHEMSLRQLANYTSLDYTATPPSLAKAVAPSILGNIQRCNTHIPTGTFTLVTALNVFEHLLGPEAAAAEMTRMVTNGGFLVVVVPFSWRYHAYPIDTARYTHTMIRYLFEKTNHVRTLFAAYGVSKPIRHGHYKDTSDEPPVPSLGANMNVDLLWIGQKLDQGLRFDPESLDYNKAFNTPISDALPQRGA